MHPRATVVIVAIALSIGGAACGVDPFPSQTATVSIRATVASDVEVRTLAFSFLSPPCDELIDLPLRGDKGLDSAATGDGAVQVIPVEPDVEPGHTFGRVPPGRHSFLAVASDKDCTGCDTDVMSFTDLDGTETARGCLERDVEPQSTDEVAVPIEPR